MRVFIAIEFEDEFKNELNKIYNSFMNIEMKCKFVEKKNLHLTLCFLGEIEKNELGLICDELEVVDEVNEFSISINSIKVFRKQKVPRILAFDILDKNKNLEKIFNIVSNNKNVRKILEKNELKLRFVPHITFGRIKSIDENQIDSLVSVIRTMDFKLKTVIKKVSFMESKLTSRGPIYNELYYINLK